MVEQAKAMLKEMMGLTDAEVAQVTPNIIKVLGVFPRFQEYRIVAEVTSSGHCAAGIQPGQKYVFAAAPPILDYQLSNCPACLRALGPVTNIVNIIMERIAEGVDPNAGIFQVAECLDPGVGHGGLGKVRFRVYAEKKA